MKAVADRRALLFRWLKQPPQTATTSDTHASPSDSQQKQAQLGLVSVQTSVRQWSGVKITEKAMQVWAEALDRWLQRLAQEKSTMH